MSIILSFFANLTVAIIAVFEVLFKNLLFTNA
jgi:hypothetical protein